MLRSENLLSETAPMAAAENKAEIKEEKTTPHSSEHSLESKISKYFSDYANTLIWTDETKREVKSQKPDDLPATQREVKNPEPNDPPTIQIAKHGLLISRELKYLFSLFSNEEKPEQKKLPPVTLTKEEKEVENLYKIISGATTQFYNTTKRPFAWLYNKAKDKLQTPARIASYSSLVPYAIPPAMRIWSHIQEIMRIAEEENLSPSQEAKPLIASIKKLGEQPNGVSILGFISENFATLPKSLYDLVISTSGVTRPKPPTTLEKIYEEKSSINLSVEDKTPSTADSYVLTRNPQKAEWQLLYYEKPGKEPRNIPLTDVPKLSGIKGKRSLTNHNIQEIKKNLSNRWDPSVQERSEWLPLVEWTRSTILSTKVVADIIDHCANKVAQNGGLLNPKRSAFIKKTKEALTHIDDHGYYSYLDSEQETALSQSLKGIYNVIWATNQLCKGHWENPGISAQAQMIQHALKAYEHYWKINWPKMTGDIGKFSNQIIDALLVISKDMLFKHLEEMAAHLHAIEHKHHLKFGALSEPFRSQFDLIENIFHERGLSPAGNPFGYSEKQESKLTRAQTEAKAKEPIINQKINSLNIIITYLERYLKKTKFEEIDLLIHHLNTFTETFSLEDKSEIRSIAQSFAQYLTQTKAEDQAKYQIPLINRRTKVTADNKTTLEKIIAHARKAKRTLEEELLDRSKYTEALAQHEKMRTEFVIRRLQQNGLINLIEATRNDNNNSDINIKQKRRLAILLADIEKKDRKQYLAKAHKKAKEFANNPKKIKELIEKIYSIDPALGHTLAVESYIAGYIQPEYQPLTPDNKPVIENNSQEIIRQDLVNILDRLPAKHVLELLKIPLLVRNANNSTVTRIITLFLLLKAKPLTEEAFGQEALPKIINFNREFLIKSLITSYWIKNQPIEIKNKIGLFLGRLAHADPEIARLIFLKNKKARKILRKECLGKIKNANEINLRKSKEVNPDPALYYESLTHTFDFNYPPQGYESENRNYKDFLEANSDAAVEIHKAIYSDNRAPSQIIDEYKNDAKKFATLVAKFIQTRLSKNSKAERKLREFFSALILCKENTAVRTHILELYEETEGSKHAKFVALITNEASTRFWQIAKKDLIEQPYRDTHFGHINAKHTDLCLTLLEHTFDTRGTPELFKEEFRNKALEFINRKKQEINSAAEEELLQAQDEIPIHCRRFLQCIDTSAQQVDYHLERLKQKMSTRKTQENEIIELNNKLSQIILILSTYTDSRSKITALAGRMIGRSTCYKKLTLVDNYLEKFKQLQKNLQSIDGPPFEQIVNAIIKTGKTLKTEHNQIISNDSSKKGILGGKIGAIDHLSSNPASLADDALERALDTDLDTISKIIKTIKPVFSYAYYLLSKGARFITTSTQNLVVSPDEKHSTVSQNIP